MKQQDRKRYILNGFISYREYFQEFFKNMLESG